MQVQLNSETETVQQPSGSMKRETVVPSSEVLRNLWKPCQTFQVSPLKILP